MGLYYTLSNGEEIEIKIEESEDYNKELKILLFYGSTTITYPMNNDLSLNEIITNIEKQYDTLKEDDIKHFYKCNGFYD